MATTKFVKFISVITVLMISEFIFSPAGSMAQSEQDWSTPINISNSGSSKDPVIVVDQKGVIHIIWEDLIDGYKYSQSPDGISWTVPATMKLPFGPNENPRLRLVASNNGTIGVFWQNRDNALYFSQVLPTDLKEPSLWRDGRVIADSALDYEVAVDDYGTLYIAYVNGINNPKSNNPPGVYYRFWGSSGWSQPVLLYESQYFRSLQTSDAHVRVGVTEQAEGKIIYVAWDDRSQKRIYLARSLDGGLTWNNAVQVMGPEASSGIEYPYNIDLAVNGKSAILIWQMGLPGSECIQYSQWSVDGGESFGKPVRMLGDFSFCPQKNKVIIQNQDFLAYALFAQSEFSLIAWNGFEWSRAQPQGEGLVFPNPLTFDTVLLGCLGMAEFNNYIYIVGCDDGPGGDIWFRSLLLDKIDSWFQASATWTPAEKIANAKKKFSELVLVSDDMDRIHAFWVQSALTQVDEEPPVMEYARWNGIKWSNPIPLPSVSGEPLHMTADVDSSGRLLLSWIDGKTGDLLFRWASADLAGRTAEWVKPILVPTGFQSNSYPNIITDASGRILLFYTVSINEQRGIYFVETIDSGNTWSQPIQVLDVAALGWDAVGQTQVCLTGDGGLHANIERYSYKGGRGEPAGTYYIRSLDGGESWSEPQALSEQPVSWSSIDCTGRQTVHRLWSEENQSKSVVFHKVSNDNGDTWGESAKISNFNDTDTSLRSVVDRGGNLHILQLTLVDEDLLITHQRWDGTQWETQQSNTIQIDKFGFPASFSASVASSGNLLLSIAVDYVFPTDELRNEVLAVGKFLGLPDESWISYPALIPTTAPAGTPITELPANLITLTPTSPLANLPDPSADLSWKRNITGILLIGGILVLTLFVILPKSKKHK